MVREFLASNSSSRPTQTSGNMSTRAEAPELREGRVTCRTGSDVRGEDPHSSNCAGYWRGFEVVGRFAFARTSSAVLVQTKGCDRSFQPSMKARILVLRSLTDLNTPRRMAWRSTMPNQTSTRFIHEAWVGVKWTLTLGFACSHSRTFGCARHRLDQQARGKEEPTQFCAS